MQTRTTGSTMSQTRMYEGQDWVCSTCGCEIMVKHPGDPAKMPMAGQFTCSCGTTMRDEHPGHSGMSDRPMATPPR